MAHSQKQKAGSFPLQRFHVSQQNMHCSGAPWIRESPCAVHDIYILKRGHKAVYLLL